MSSRQKTRSPSRFRISWQAGLAGVAAAALLIGVAGLAGAFFPASAAPLIALGSTFIDFTPAWLKNFAIETFGFNDKAVLFLSMGITVAALAAAAGILAYRRWRYGVAAIVALCAVTSAAVLTRSGAGPLDVLPTLLGGAAGLAALRLLLAAIPGPGRADPAAMDPAPAEPTQTGSAPAGPAHTGPASAGILPRTPDRRRFFQLAGTVALAAAVAGGAGRAVAGLRGTAAAFRNALTLPAPFRAAPALPAGVQSPVPGVTPFITANADFYRIDTALSVPEIDAAAWELRVHGLVEQDLTLTFQDLLDADLIESHVTLTCVSNPVGGSLAGTATWLGYPLRELLRRAGPLPGADMVLSKSIDGFTASTPLAALTDGRDAMLAVGMNGEPLPLEHGYPVRMVVPGLYGFVSATKWVVDLEVTRFADRTAYWTDRGWSPTGPIKTAARIEVPRSFARLPAGRTAVGGTAWAQQRGVVGVEIQVDDGPWQPAVLAADGGIDTWRQWSFDWDAVPGTHYLRIRAVDAVDGVQTPDRADPIPDGASGWQSIQVTVE